MLETYIVHVNNNYDNVVNMLNIPNYPEFKLVDKLDKPIFKQYTKDFAPYSDFNLLSLLAWNTAGVSAYSILNNNLVIRLKDYLGDSYVYSVLGVTNIQCTLETLLRDFNSLSLVPEVVIQHLGESTMFVFEEDRDNFDYIMNCPNITNLDGSDFRHLRHDINHFTNLYKNTVIKPIDLNQSTTLTYINELDNKWYSKKGYDNEKIAEQEKVFSNFLNNCNDFDMINLGFYHNEKLIGYILSERITDTQVISHFGCSDADYTFCDYALKYAVAVKLSELGIVHQNQEQDAGLSGLRTAKMFYNPEFFLKKYKIGLK